jgi:hypothetical protein
MMKTWTVIPESRVFGQCMPHIASAWTSSEELQTVKWPRYFACKTLTIRGVPQISTATTGIKKSSSVIGESNGETAPSCDEGHNICFGVRKVYDDVLVAFWGESQLGFVFPLRSRVVGSKGSSLTCTFPRRVSPPSITTCL